MRSVFVGAPAAHRGPATSAVLVPRVVRKVRGPGLFAVAAPAEIAVEEVHFVWHAMPRLKD